VGICVTKVLSHRPGGGSSAINVKSDSNPTKFSHKAAHGAIGAGSVLAGSVDPEAFKSLKEEYELVRAKVKKATFGSVAGISTFLKSFDSEPPPALNAEWAAAYECLLACYSVFLDTPETSNMKECTLAIKTILAVRAEILYDLYGFIDLWIYRRATAVRPSDRPSDRPTDRPSDRPTVGPGPGPRGPTGSIMTTKTNSEYQNTYKSIKITKNNMNQ
jgi:hypothetical protein